MRFTVFAEIKTYWNGLLLQKLGVLACLAVMVFAVGSFAYNGVYRSFQYTEPDPWHLYTAGHMWGRGENPYDYDLFQERYIAIAGEPIARLNPSAFYYPPLGSLLLSAVSAGSFETAHLLLVIIFLAVLIVCLALLVYILSWFRPIGLAEITLIIFFLATAFARSTTRMLNPSVIICLCLLGAFVLSRKREVLGGIVLAIVSMKPTFLPPQLLYYIRQRHFRLLLTCIIAGALITILPLVFSGRPVIETLQMYSSGITERSSGTVNDPSPMSAWSSILAHLHPLVYRILNAQNTLTNLIGWGLVGLLALYTLVFAADSKQGDWARLSNFAGVSLLTLLCVYHRHYDVFLLFPAILYLYVHARRVGAWTWYIFLIAVLAVLALPSDVLVHFTLRNPVLNDSYLWRLLLPFQTWMTMALLGAYLWVNTRAVLADRRALAGLSVQPLTERLQNPR